MTDSKLRSTVVKRCVVCDVEMPGCGRTRLYCGTRCRDKVQAQRFGYGVRVSTTGPEYVVNEETGCWEWQRFVNRGYPQVGWRKMHHIYWERANNTPVPEGYDVHHLCKVRHCVNPDHLIAEPSKVHRRSHGPLNEEKVAEIRRLLAEGELSHAKIGKIIGCSAVQVGQISRGTRWT